MGSFNTFSIGATALFASQRAVEVAAHNVANAGTAGFTRQRLEVQTAVPMLGTQGLRGDGHRGMGVQVLGVDRLRDRLADVAYRTEAGVAGAATARSSGLSRVEQVSGPYAEGAPQAFSRFLAAWDGLSLTPTDPAARSSVLNTGAGLASSLRSTAEGLATVSREIGARVQGQVDEANGLLRHVAQLNLSIQDAVIGGHRPNDLLDQRDLALDRLTSLTGARVVARDDEMVDVVVGPGSGTRVVTGATATPLVAGGSPLSVQASGQEVVLTGEVGGHLSVVNVDVPSFAAQLDAVADGLREAVNAVHERGTGLDGSTGQAFFAGSGAADLALAPGLTETTVAASASGKPADGDNALAMSALRTTPAVGNATVGQALRAFGGRVGQAVADAERSASTAQLGLTGARLTRDSVNGVNIDEEMVDLVKFQHAYSAASRVITVVDGMLNKIINEMGR